MPDLDPEEGWTVGGDIDELRVTLRIAGDDLNPDEITRLLGVQPTFSAAKGTKRESRGSTVVQRTGIWALTPAESPEWLISDAIHELLRRLPDDIQTWQSLSARYKLDLYCGLFLQSMSRGFELPSELLAEIVRRHLALQVDIYWAGDNDTHDDLDGAI